MSAAATAPASTGAPWRPSGQVIGVLLNHRPALDALGAAVHAPPYKAPPQAPVLYLKPRNTWVGDGAVVTLPRGVPALEVGATIGLVIGRGACRVSAADALQHVAGFILVADLCVPHESVYRPSVKLRAGDGFCPLGPRLWPLAAVPSVDDIELHTLVDGHEVHRCRTDQRIRPAAQLIADVSAFMTLNPGDVLLLGTALGAPQVGAGHGVTLSAAGLGALRFDLAAESTGESM